MEIERFVGIECQLEPGRVEMAKQKKPYAKWKEKHLRPINIACAVAKKSAHNNGTAAKRRVANFMCFFYVRKQL